MQQRLTFVTVGAKNLQQLKKFYIEKFGWKPLKDEPEIVFFKLNGIILSLFPVDELANDVGIKLSGIVYKGITLAVNYNSEEEVDAVFAELECKGVKIKKAPEKAIWGGYSGYVEDIENNLWEIAYNPFLEMDEIGNVVTHR